MTDSRPERAERYFTRFRRWFWRPPRAHGEIEEERAVSFLELFYDLVYVVVIAQAAHHLADHISLEGVLQFAIIFSLIWIAWLQGTLHHDLHGRRDGRSRSFIFLQMIILAMLAVFTGDAAGETGAQFAIVYTAYLVVMAYLWYTVRRQDSEEYSAATSRFLLGMLAIIGAMVLSVFLPEDVRIWFWGAVVLVWLALSAGAVYVPEIRRGMDLALSPSESMVERFGLFTIIVLGESVVGVVDGWSHAHDLDLVTLATGTLALIVGFGFWWIYFDFTGRRLPREGSPTVTRWQTSHLPVTLAIAAAGAGMVSLIEHAHDPSTPAGTAWLLAGAVAVGLAGLVVTMQALQVFRQYPQIFHRLAVVMLVGATLALGVGWLQPTPWLFAFCLVAILSGIWGYAIYRWVRTSDGSPGDYLPN